MNDNNEMPELHKLLVDLAMSRRRVAEETAFSVSILLRIREILFNQEG